MFKKITCFVLHCDGCGKPLESDYVIHYEHECLDDAEGYEWLITRDGRHFCRETECLAKAPPCTCPEDDPECSSDCEPGCPCLRHERVEAEGPCPKCGETFLRQAELNWHLYKHRAEEEAQGGHSG